MGRIYRTFIFRPRCPWFGFRPKDQCESWMPFDYQLAIVSHQFQKSGLREVYHSCTSWDSEFYLVFLKSCLESSDQSVAYCLLKMGFHCLNWSISCFSYLSRNFHYKSYQILATPLHLDSTVSCASASMQIAITNWSSTGDSELLQPRMPFCLLENDVGRTHQMGRVTTHCVRSSSV